MASRGFFAPEPAPGSARGPLRPLNNAQQLEASPAVGGLPAKSRPAGISRWQASPPDNAALYGASPTAYAYQAAPVAEPAQAQESPPPPSALEALQSECSALRERLMNSETECTEALLYISTLQEEAAELRGAATTQQLGWLAEALGAEALARAEAESEAAARKAAEASCAELEGRLAEALQATVELETELANVWEARVGGGPSPASNQASDDSHSEEARALRAESSSLRAENERLRAQVAAFGAAPAELEKAKERGRKYKSLARELHSRLRQLTLSHCEELAVVRAQLRTAYTAAAATSASPPLVTPTTRR